MPETNSTDRQPVPTVSVLIPSRDRNLHLENTLENLISQANDVSAIVEIIVGDNSPTIERDNLVSRLSETHPVKHLTHQCDIGITRNLISLVEAASGQYIILFGDDDAPRQDLLHLLLLHIEAHSPDVTRIPYHYVHSSKPLCSFETTEHHLKNHDNFSFVNFSRESLVDFEEKSGFISSHLFKASELRSIIDVISNHPAAPQLLENVYFTKMYTNLAMHRAKGFWTFNDTLVHQRVPPPDERNFFSTTKETYSTVVLAPAECYTAVKEINPRLGELLLKIHFEKLKHIKELRRKGISSFVFTRDYLRFRPKLRLRRWIKTFIVILFPNAKIY